jgi:hypothetical protein
MDTDIASIARRSYEAFRDENRELAESLLAPDFTLTSPYDDDIDRAAFFSRCWPGSKQVKEFQIERIATDANGAFVTYLFTRKDGTASRNTEYLKVWDGKIHSADVYFGANFRDGIFQTQETS